MNILNLSEIFPAILTGKGIIAYSFSATVWFVLTFCVWGLSRWGLPRLKKITSLSDTNLDDLLVEGIARHMPAFLYFGAFAIALSPLELSPLMTRLVRVFGALWLLLAAVRLANGLLKFLVFNVWLPRHGDETLTRKLKTLAPFLSVILWLVGTLVLLDNFGFKLSAVITGLGIGGIAVALASQAVLGDLFSYFAILFDRPFEVGDFIIVGDMMGVVEHIGIKTTRIRSLGGEQLVFSNTDLTGSRVRNYKRMQERRVLFKVGITYNTPMAVMNEVPELLKTIVKSVERTRFDRAHFAAFGPSSLDLEIVYYVLSPDYNVYMDIQQNINFAIKKGFESRGIDFAFPTQTIYMAGGQTPPVPAKG
ncbi:MAG: mechanosensitive ion channel family protein [Elusimicrobia bacterium]|jgi:small-conductance mechanosensitive channel|nr:mechanosensitive ion channel family protein [Elusimicrobiota bacterium]